MGYLMRGTSLWGYPELVRELGGDPIGLYAQFDISVGVDVQLDAFIPVSAFAGLLEVTARDLQCPDFGLRLSRGRDLDMLGPVAVVVRNAPTVLDAIEAAARFLYVHSPILRVVPGHHTDSHFQFRYVTAESITPYPLQTVETTLGGALQINRILVGAMKGISISLMHTRHGPASAYREAYGCPVHFGAGWSGFEISRELAAKRIAHADPEAGRIATRYLEATYTQPSSAFSDRVAELAVRLLPTGMCTVDTIAAQLAVHPRTLNRRLALEGLSCQDVVDSVRRTQAIGYLSIPELPFGQIAGMLGYSEQSALNRACRRWFGTTPRRYRAHLIPLGS